MQLYDYFRSSAAYRVRIALNLKGLDYQRSVVNLLQGEDSQAPYRSVNPQGLVPALVLDEVGSDQVLNQSLAICEYLDEVYPQQALLPQKPLARAQVRAMAQVIACDVHPLNNLRVLNYLRDELKVDEQQKQNWYQHWIREGLQALEQYVAQYGGRFCYGDRVSLADICLVPQMYNARRFQCNLDGLPKLQAIDAYCRTREAFEKAHPDKQLP